jgi:hypothetical protein
MVNMLIMLRFFHLPLLRTTIYIGRYYMLKGHKSLKRMQITYCNIWWYNIAGEFFQAGDVLIPLDVNYKVTMPGAELEQNFP